MSTLKSKKSEPGARRPARCPAGYTSQDARTLQIGQRVWFPAREVSGGRRYQLAEVHGPVVSLTDCPASVCTLVTVRTSRHSTTTQDVTYGWAVWASPQPGEVTCG